MVKFSAPCVRCGHSSDDHRFYDGVDTIDSTSEARCVWTADPRRQGLDRDCHCPDFRGEVVVNE